MQEMLHLRFSGIQFEEAAVTFENIFGRVLTRQLRPSRLVFSSGSGLERKPAVAFLYSIPIAPCCAYVFSDHGDCGDRGEADVAGPILRARCVWGSNDSVFTVLKFRSMHINAEAKTGPVGRRRTTRA